MGYVVGFVQMQRFDDLLLVEVLGAMRTLGGKKISEEAWRAITATEIKQDDADTRLRDARDWYECPYGRRIVPLRHARPRQAQREGCCQTPLLHPVHRHPGCPNEQGGLR